MSSGIAAPAVPTNKKYFCNNCKKDFASIRNLDKRFLCEECRSKPGVQGYSDPNKRGLASGSPKYWEDTKHQLNIVTERGVEDGCGNLKASAETAQRNVTSEQAPASAPAPKQPQRVDSSNDSLTEFQKWRADVYSSSALDDSVRVYLLRLSEFADFATGANCYPKEATLAARLGCSRWEIRRRRALAKEWIKLWPMVVGFRSTSKLVQFIRPAHATHGPWEGPRDHKRPGAKLPKSCKTQ